MNISLETVVFAILLIDSIGANIMAWSPADRKWYHKHFRIFSRYFPMSRGWAGYYFILVLWIGYLLYHFGAFTP